MNRQNQVRRTIKKLKEEVAASRSTVIAAREIEAKLATARTLADELRNQRDGALLNVDKLTKALVLKTAEAEAAGSVMLEVQRDCTKLRKHTEELTAKIGELQEEIDSLRSEEYDTRKLRRRLQERHEENIKLAQQVRDLETALASKVRGEAMAERVNREQGGSR